ncbi:anthranilate synthase component I family protein [Candidatus Micrarchaeota archaeon]|nr:anthranilate synthase component I family protein [Candidatus Micrarchaeota archaeon]
MVKSSSPWVLLYSPHAPARWSYFLAEPFAEFQAGKSKIQIFENDRVSQMDVGNPLSELESFFKSYQKARMRNSQNSANELRFDPFRPPFQGGAVGYLSYEALHYLEDVALPKTDDVQAPWLDFLFFDAGLAFDHWENKIHPFGPVAKTDGMCTPFAAALKHLEITSKKNIEHASTASGKTGPISSNFSKPAYVHAVKKIQTHIASGETFQANLSQRFQAETSKAPWDVFVRLNQINPSPYSAFFQSGNLSLVSASPELLFSLEGDHLVTRPIAGTRPRGKTPDEDARLESELKENGKENAEHAMLVDLERNDVGRICTQGSVKVQDGFAVEKYSHVQHLVSQVEGRLQPNKTAFDAIRALFPGGTITGCPKVRTMQLLREVEPLARGPYTGSLGWIGWNGDAAFNILIRTIYFKRKNGSASSMEKTSAWKNAKNPSEKQTAYFHAGGGIVYDSVPELEYRESLQKAEAMRQSLG